MYYYNKIVEKYKKGFLSAEALTSIGKMYESDGDDKKALEIYSRVVKEYPEIVTEYAKMRQTVLNDRVKN
ncbi:MAG: tol-pal system protein YbgF [Candidatus Aerophobetes bacterium ADurb.Bin490]|nr:MAG: tol-pal system protein YbgF [Candidatus Aerophobetes bacterium ADurb.Bin490]